MSTLIVAGDLVTGAQVIPATDGELNLQTGASGAKVNALAFTANGDATFFGNANAPTLQQGGVAVPRMVLATAQAATSGIAIDFTSIPPWAKRVTLMINNISTTGTNVIGFQLGAGSVDATSTYGGACSTINAANATNIVANTTMGTFVASVVASVFYSGRITLSHMGSNLWVWDGVVNPNGANNSFFLSGTKSLSGALDRVRFTTSTGVDTFDNGSFNIMYEG